MDPIRIPCSSCGGKLVIRSEKLLGRAVNCPRCKQFVQIPTSALAQQADQQTPDSQALTSVDLDTVSLKPSEPIGTPLDPARSTSLTHDFESIDDFMNESGGFRDAHSQDLEVPKKEVAAAIFEAGSNTPDPRLAWETSSTRKRQFYLLSGIAAIVCLISMILFMVFLKSIAPEDAVEIAANSVPGDVETNTVPPKDPADENSTDSPLTSSDPPSGDSPQSMAQNGVADNSVEDSTASSNEEPATPIKEPESAIDSLLQSAGVPNDNAMSGNNTNLTPNTDQAGSNPLDLLLDQGQRDKPTLPDMAANDSQQLEISPEIPEAFRDLAPVFDLGAGSMLPDARQISPDEVEGGSAGAFQVDVASLYHPDPSPIPVWDELKHTKVIALRIPNVPFLEALNTIESIYGLPCDWDLAALRLTPIDLNANVTLEINDTTVEQVYSDLLANVGLRLNAQPGRLPQIVPAEMAQRDLPTTISLTELLASGVKLEDWLGVLNQLVPEADQKLKLDGESIVFTEDLPLKYRLELSEIVEKIKRAIDVKILKPIEPLDHAGLDDELQQWRLKLNKTGVENFARRRPVGLMLSKLAKELGFSLVVDWGECWNHGLVPSASMVVLTKNRTLSQMSRFVLEEYALVLIVDKNQRLVLTTQEIQRSLRYFHVIKIPEGIDINAVRQSFAKLTPVDGNGRSALQVVQIPGDALPKLAVVRMCAPSVSQLADEGLVTALGLEASN